MLVDMHISLSLEFQIDSLNQFPNLETIYFPMQIALWLVHCRTLVQRDICENNLAVVIIHTNTNYKLVHHACAHCNGRPELQIPRESSGIRWAAHNTQVSNACDIACSKCVLCIYEMACMS